jgi:hypothetical protein
MYWQIYINDGGGWGQRGVYIFPNDYPVYGRCIQ